MEYGWILRVPTRDAALCTGKGPPGAGPVAHGLHGASTKRASTAQGGEKRRAGSTRLAARATSTREPAPAGNSRGARLTA